jgi:hypothetical protein
LLMVRCTRRDLSKSPVSKYLSFWHF